MYFLEEGKINSIKNFENFEITDDIKELASKMTLKEMVDFDQVKHLWTDNPKTVISPFGTFSKFASPKPVVTTRRIIPKCYSKPLQKIKRLTSVAKPKSSLKTSSMLIAVHNRKLIRLFPTRTIMTRSMAMAAGLVF